MASADEHAKRAGAPVVLKHGVEFFAEVAIKCGVTDLTAPTPDEKMRVAEWFAHVQSGKAVFHKELKQLWNAAY